MKKKIRHFKLQIDLQIQASYNENKISKKKLHILEDGTSGVQVGDTEQVTV